MRKAYNSHHRDKEYKVGDWVCVRLHPYRQTLVSLRRNYKLAPRYYNPFQILQWIGKVAHKLELPKESCIHPIFHVSLLKEKLGSKISVQPQLPVSLTTDDGI